MGFVIGMDEAGYGPNLGPLVLTATVWEVPGRWPKRTDFWQVFADIAERKAAIEAFDDDAPEAKRSRKGRPAGRKKSVFAASDPCANAPSANESLTQAISERLHIADSKEVYSPSIGLGALERGVLATFGIASRVPSISLNQLLDGLMDGEAALDDPDNCDRPERGGRARDLWFTDEIDLPLPVSEEGRLAESAAEKWRTICESTGVRLRAIRSDVVSPRRWNRENRRTDNKATTLSRLHLQLLRRVWNPDEPGPTVVIADKHGGRNYYGDLLVECLDGRMVCCRGESRAASVYGVGPTEIRFEAKAERHFPVAVASMVSKYIRELTMELFNQFWRNHLPELKPTHGYPRDAHRFRREVAAVQSRLDIADDVLWRER
ncbi:MAG TPA: hypothetical protein VFG04_25040 [Planctomycetaceae bacterium]|jgi:hypothetical protein|nr:hypothetical protein [Planctomycetaceae bacterium]